MTNEKTRVLFEDPQLRVSFVDRGSTEHVLVCFTDAGLEMGHVGEALDQERRRKTQFVKTARLLACSAIYVSDKTVSWGNHIDFDHIADIVRPVTECLNITLLGVSMGGFNAIVASNYLNASLCMAFCPQFSVDPVVMPREHRYEAFVSNIKNFKIPSLENQFNPNCNYYTFNGSRGEDQYHWERFPILHNARHYVFPEIDHRVARELRKREILVPLIGTCMRGEDPASILAGNVSYFIHQIRVKQT